MRSKLHQGSGPVFAIVVVPSGGFKTSPQQLLKRMLHTVFFFFLLFPYFVDYKTFTQFSTGGKYVLTK